MLSTKLTLNMITIILDRSASNYVAYRETPLQVRSHKMLLRRKHDATEQMSYRRGAYGKMRAVLKSRIKHNTLESAFVVLKSRKQGRTLLLATFRLFWSFRSVLGFTNTPLEIYTCCEVHILSEKYCVFTAPAVPERMS